MKFYVVKKGRKTGIYNSWEDCEKQVKGFSGAVFKSFLTREEADAFMASKINTSTKKKPKPKTAKKPKKNNKNNKNRVYQKKYSDENGMRFVVGKKKNYVAIGRE